MSRVFIGIPTFNRPDLVIETIESVRAQIFTDYAVVVSDNCSEGDAPARVRAYVEALGDPRFTFCQQPINSGEYGQGRFFMTASQGATYVMILHDDDRLSPGYLRLATATLDEQPDAALYVANPWLIDGEGKRQAAETRQYLADHGRVARAAGAFDIRDTHLRSGFTPISGTLFRRGALEESGFVDADCEGNFPFECNIFLRLGDIGAKGWFSPSQLLEVRFHQNSLRHSLRLMQNPQVVGTMLKLFERRRYGGWQERRRKAIVSRLYRAQGLIDLERGDIRACRSSLARACKVNPLSPHAWRLRLLASLSPARLRTGAAAPDTMPYTQDPRSEPAGQPVVKASQQEAETVS